VTHLNLSIAYEHIGNDVDALHHAESAILIDPSLPNAHLQLSCLLLGQGAYARGWHEFEWRHQEATGRAYADDPCRPGQLLPRPSSYLPLTLAGQRLHLLNAQGIGDELFFLRFAPELRRRGAWLAYAATPKLRPLLEDHPALDRVLGVGDCLAEADHAFMVTEAPLVLGMQDDDPIPPPFALAPKPGALADLRKRLADLGHGPYLGVTWWAGTPPAKIKTSNADTFFRSIAPGELASYLKDWPGPVLVLQRQPHPGEIEEFAQTLGRPVHDFSALNDDLERMLALLALLDEHVGVDNTNMHLAASLGRPARVLLTRRPDWRWGATETQSPWFPGFHLYRQAQDGDWAQALAQLAQDLKQVLP